MAKLYGTTGTFEITDVESPLILYSYC